MLLPLIISTLIGVFWTAFYTTLLGTTDSIGTKLIYSAFYIAGLVADVAGVFAFFRRSSP